MEELPDQRGGNNIQDAKPHGAYFLTIQVPTGTRTAPS